MSNTITITEVEHEGMTFDFATQDIGNGDTAYWLIHEGTLITADFAEETDAETTTAEFFADWIRFVDGVPTAEDEDAGDYDDYRREVEHAWYFDRI